MNPSYNAGGTGNSGVKPGMIASGPGTTGVEPASRMPTGGRPRGLTGGDFVANITSGGNPRTPSNKKILIIAGVAGVLLVVAIVVVMIMQGNTSKPAAPNPDTVVDDGGSSDSGTSDYQYDGENEKFYQYANYLLNGDKTVTEGLDLGVYDEEKEYAITKAISEDDVIFIKQAVTLWKAFYSIYNNTDTNANVKSGSKSSSTALGGELGESVSLQNVQMNFLGEYAGLTARTEQGMWKLYDSKGLNIAIQTMKDDYNKFSNMASQSIVKWAQAKSAEAETALKLYAKYDELGCIKNNKYDKDCIDNNVSALEDLMKEYVEARAKVETSDIKITELSKELAKNCFKIRDELGEIEKDTTTDDDGEEEDDV